MTQLPVEDQTMHGYEPPMNTQFNVFLDNRVGRMMELMDLLHGQAIRVAAFMVNDSADYAVQRLVVTRPDDARRLLQHAHWPFSETEVLAVALPAGVTLVDLCRALVQAEVNILYAYPLLARPQQRPGIVLHTDDQTISGRVLRRKGFVLLGEKELAQPDDQGG